MSLQLDGQAQPPSDRENTGGINVPLQSLNKAEALFDTTTPIVMLNLLRFKASATYPTDSNHHSASPSTSGREAYLSRYLPAFQAIASKMGTDSTPIIPIFIGAPTHSLVTRGSVAIDMGAGSLSETDSGGDNSDGQWDMVGLISYPNLDTFRTLITSPEYLETAQQHRLASLKDWRLIVTRAVEA